MASPKSLIDLLGAYDNSDEPMPVWNSRAAMLGIPISFIVRKQCRPRPVRVC